MVSGCGPRIAHVISTPAGVGGAERIVAALDHYVKLSEDLESSGPIAVACDDLRHQLRARWPEDECTMRLCNAFQNASIR
jgi:hypothetical protein